MALNLANGRMNLALLAARFPRHFTTGTTVDVGSVLDNDDSPLRLDVRGGRTSIGSAFLHPPDVRDDEIVDALLGASPEVLESHWVPEHVVERLRSADVEAFVMAREAFLRVGLAEVLASFTERERGDRPALTVLSEVGDGA